MNTDPKSGTKTTEFWVAIAPAILGLIEGQRGDPENGKYLIICGTILGVAYIASRTWLKVQGTK